MPAPPAKTGRYARPSRAYLESGGTHSGQRCDHGVSSADGHSVVAQGVFYLSDGELAEVKDAGGKHRIGPGVDSGSKVGDGTRATAGDQRHTDLPPDGLDQLQVEAVLGAIGIHRVEQDLPCAQLGRPCAPRDRVQSSPLTAPMGRHLKLVCDSARLVAATPDIGRQHQDLRAETIGDVGDQARAGDRGRVDPHLVRTGAQQLVHIVNRAQPPTHGQRDEHLLSGPSHHVVGGLPVAAAGGDVEEGQLVRTLLVVAFGQLDGITGIAQILEVDRAPTPRPCPSTVQPCN